MKITRKRLNRLIHRVILEDRKTVQSPALNEKVRKRKYRGKKPVSHDGTRRYIVHNNKNDAFSYFSHARQRDLTSMKIGGREPAGIQLKPRGLWYSCDFSFDDFSARNDFQFNMLIDKSSRDIPEEIVVNPARVLFIKTPAEFEAFEREFGDVFDYKNQYSFASTELSNDDISNYKIIHWDKVAEKYAGIEICPYQQQFRMESDWYNPWDYAGGCIWDKSGLLYHPYNDRNRFK